MSIPSSQASEVSDSISSEYSQSVSTLDGGNKIAVYEQIRILPFINI
jgi:hypothetical protein